MGLPNIVHKIVSRSVENETKGPSLKMINYVKCH